MTNEAWNRCDACGKFIALKDFDKGATRNIVSHDSEAAGTYYHETYETLCKKHAKQDDEVKQCDHVLESVTTGDNGMCVKCGYIP